MYVHKNASHNTTSMLTSMLIHSALQHQSNYKKHNITCTPPCGKPVTNTVLVFIGCSLVNSYLRVFTVPSTHGIVLPSHPSGKVSVGQRGRISSNACNIK